MASTSSSAPTSHYEYDVFLSYRGEDTRYSFTDHLYEALHKAGIMTFRDDDEIRQGEDVRLEIERSIKQSRASVIVFSKNFANSRWCLDELWLILEQKRNVGHFVLPVFYKVDPSDVWNQRGSYSIEAKEEGTKWTEDNVNRWKAALTEVANLNGMVLKGPETAFIAEIVNKVYRKLDLKLVSCPTVLTGIEFRAQGVNPWLRCEQEQHSSPVLAICGMGGSGKTTLAKYIYNSNKQNFESSSFLEEIENKPGVLLRLQKQLLRDVLGNNITTISNVSEGTFHIQKAIQMKKVLIVVDDIDDLDKLSALFGTNLFPTQSKIIITTRHLNINTWGGSISRGCHVHQLELLNNDEALELISFHAFGSKIPVEGFEELALQVVQYCEGNPLALTVLGSTLTVSAQDQRTMYHMKEIWRSKIHSLNSLKGDLDDRIERVLRKSFDSLPHSTLRELFLLIACLFVGEYVSHVGNILDYDLNAKSGITTLINRCLVTKSGDGLKLTMNNILRDMAIKIVREVSEKPERRDIVLHKDESFRLLRKGNGSNTIEGLSVDMREAEQWMTSEAFKTTSLVKMVHLKFLQLNYVVLTGSYENFPDLRCLRWHGCYLKTIPSGLLTSFLVALYMCYGDLEEFDPPMVLRSLKILDLQSSAKLVSICNLYRLPKLETLILTHCTSLTHLCKTIGDLENLSFLSLAGCTKLLKDSSNQMFVSQLERLKTLFTSGGIPEQPLHSLPHSLFELSLSGNLFEILPSNIDLKFLRTLNLTSCPNLKSISCLPSMLESLCVDWCSSLENITFQSARFTLREFTYEGCFQLCDIQGLFKLMSIEKLDEADLGHMQWIKPYQYHDVDLVGDEITKGRPWKIQMLYEYGIRSTYLQGIKDQSMETHEYTSSSRFLSFRVPLHPKKHRIQVLNVTFLYRSSSGEDRNIWPPLFARISNRSKGVIWVYNPVVYCIPRLDNDVVWLSYWPIGNTLDAGDEVHVHILAEVGTLIASGCGASLVYMNDDDVEKEEKCEGMKGEEVIGGDLSGFEVTKGGYYLCRHDFFKSMIPASLFGENIQITDSRRWRISNPSADKFAFDQEVNAFRNPCRHEFQKDAFIFSLEDTKLQMQNIEHLKIELTDILWATENFDEKYCIGSGGYGKVYRCKIPELGNSTVAIKRLFSREGSQGVKEFLSEINVLSRCEHPNIASLVGFCIEDNEMLLVYEHASNGSLDDYLGSTDKIINLSWVHCLKMCIHIAHGLSYLHATVEDEIRTTHHHIKSTNIMLGKNWEAKIMDFCFSKFHDVNHELRTIKTNVYLDPEYAKTGMLEKASDIYSFGVILFEIFSGKLAYDKTYIEENEKGLAPIAQRHFNRGTVKEMLAPKIMGDASDLGLALKLRPDHDSVDAFSRIAYQCLAETQAERPTIQAVIEELNNAVYFQNRQSIKVQKLEQLKIPLKDILSSTHDFNQDCHIGSGAYGNVYKAELKMKSKDELIEMSRTVAVKRLTSREDDQVNKGFFAELDVASKCKHPNLVSFLGFCVENGEMLLVYELASNGSLDDYLGSNEMVSNHTWEKRLEICIDVAQGLQYMHTHMEHKEGIIHRDIKSANILLGENLEAKIADFGLSKVHYGNQGVSTINTKTIAGTEVYLDPEYAMTGKLKKASDIYSFGVVLFEIFSGKLAYDKTYMEESAKGLAAVAQRHFENGTLKEILDSEIMDESSILGLTLKVRPDLDSLDSFSKIAYHCLARNQDKRPTIQEVIHHLKEALQFQENRKKTLKFSLEHIKMCVQNFSDDRCIMRGRYGMLYNGTVEVKNRPKKVVVKRFTGQEHGFLKEFEVLFRYKQENIIGLVGYCKEMDERIIVYEHASKGCLNRYLKDTNLSWTKRLKICIDIANGLKFLHEGGEGLDVVIHRGLRSSNILLTKDWKPKICGFEQASTYPTNEEINYVINDGYCDPLYWETKILTKESDIYSFGVILFDILCGRLACPTEDGDQSVLNSLTKSHYEEAGLKEIVFEGIKKHIVLKSFATFQTIIFQCLHEKREARPTAAEVAVNLQKALEFQEAYEMRKAKLDRTYEEILHEFSRSPEIYSTMRKKDIYNILSKGILLEEDKLITHVTEDTIWDLEQSSQFTQEHDEDYHSEPIISPSIRRTYSKRRHRRHMPSITLDKEEMMASSSAISDPTTHPKKG